MKSYTLKELADRFSLEFVGVGETQISGVCSLEPGLLGCISFFNNSRLKHQLLTSQASAIIVGRRDKDALTGSGLVTADPGLAFARIAQLFDASKDFLPNTHPSSVIDETAQIGNACYIAPRVVIGKGVQIGEGCYVGAGCVIGDNAIIGKHSRLEANITIYANVIIGQRALIQAGAVIGSRGFGNAPTPEGTWVEIPQFGTVVIGDDVEVGANTTIDRGALSNTVIANGVKIDNLIQIAHNCIIGENTAIAACTGIAGSAVIGKNCLIGGASTIGGHLNICDKTIIMGNGMITSSITTPGVYGSGLPFEPVKDWRRAVANIRRLQKLKQRVANLERALKIDSTDELEGE